MKTFVVFVDCFCGTGVLRTRYFTKTKRLEIEAEDICKASEIALASVKTVCISKAVSMIWPKWEPKDKSDMRLNFACAIANNP